MTIHDWQLWTLDIGRWTAVPSTVFSRESLVRWQSSGVLGLKNRLRSTRAEMLDLWTFVVLALSYLATAVYLGERLCRRFYRFVSPAQRWVAGTLAGYCSAPGLLIWLRAFSRPQRLLYSGETFCFFVVAGGAIFWPHRRPKEDASWIEPRAEGSDRWDWLTLGTISYLQAG